MSMNPIYAPPCSSKVADATMRGSIIGTVWGSTMPLKGGHFSNYAMLGRPSEESNAPWLKRRVRYAASAGGRAGLFLGGLSLIECSAADLGAPRVVGPMLAGFVCGGAVAKLSNVRSPRLAFEVAVVFGLVDTFMWVRNGFM